MKDSKILYLALCLAFLATAHGAWWYGTADQDWYNGDNYGIINPGESAPPNLATNVAMHLAYDTLPRRSCIIDGGIAECLNITIWTQTANEIGKLVVTNAADLTVANQLSIGSNQANTGAEIYIDGGSQVAIKSLHVGRSINGYMGYAIFDISGEDTVVTTSQEVLLGYSTTPSPGTISVRDGAVLIHNGAGGSFLVNYANTDNGLLDISGGEVRINLDRTFQVPGWIENGWVVAYGGEGVVNYYYDATTGYTILRGEMLPEIPENATISTGFSDDFEGTHNPDYYWCDDPLNICTPPIGYQWTTAGTSPDLHYIDCTTFPGRKVLNLTRTETSGAQTATAKPRPNFMRTNGFIYRFEHDFYIPSGSGEYGLGFQPSPLNDMFHYFAIEGRNFYYSRNGVRYDSGYKTPVDQWAHVRIDMDYEEKCYSIWLTPEGGEETIVVANAPIAPDTMAITDIRGTLSLSPPPPGTSRSAYIDNFEIKLIDKTPQGYPDVKPADNAITIDGNIDLNTEWANVVKVAHKPDGSKGNFNPVMPYSYVKGLDSDTVVDVYMTHDYSNFYIAMTGNNMTFGEAGDLTRGRVEIAFTWGDNDPNSTETTISDLFIIHATEPIDANPVNNAHAFVIQQSVDFAPLAGVDVSDFIFYGGEVAYSKSVDVMAAEIKIPFDILPASAVIEAGQTVNVQFTYIQTPTGDNRASTSPIGENVPGVMLGEKLVPFAAGITFPLLGDLNGDGCVNYDDLLLLATQWLTLDSGYELAGDNVLNYKDYSAMVANWEICIE